MSYSRQVHVVRCQDPNNANNWLDVKVLDKIVYQAPNGTEVLLDFSNPIPKIIDDTGDGNGKTPGSFSRKSHMKRLTNPDQTSYCFDAEILDAFCFHGPNGIESVSINITQDNSTAIIDDNTGNGLTQNSGGSDSRHGHVMQLTGGKARNTDAPNSGNPSDGQSHWPLCILMQDSITSRGANGIEMILINPANLGPDVDEFENDTTKYTTAGDGSKVPPMNTDPNNYVMWPTDGSSAGPWLGKNLTELVNQGLLWWIVNSPPIGGPWYWYVIQQQTMQPQVSPTYITFLTAPGPDQGMITGGGKGVYFLNNYIGGSTVWGRDTPEVPPEITHEGYPIPVIGFDTISHAAWYGDASSASLSNPNDQYPPHDEWPGGYPNRVPNGAAVLPPTIGPFDGAAPSELEWVQAGNPPFANGPDFAAFGMLPFTQPPTEPNNNEGIGIGFGGHTNFANIWQMTNMGQPPLENPELPWYDPDYDGGPSEDRVINRYKPTPEAMQQCAQTFASIWNACSASMNNIDALTGPDPGHIGGTYTPNPTWGFGTPFLYRGPGDLSFLAGMCASIGLAPILETFTSTLIGVAQLDTQYWDTSKYPPLPWSTKPGGGFNQPP